MKLIDVEYTFDNSKLLFYFTSDGRVDFRVDKVVTIDGEYAKDLDDAVCVVKNDDGTGTLFVGGDAALIENRVRMFIKAELLKQIKEIIRTVPRDFWPRRICLRDTSSRWGSCSTTGTMSFSWRLGFAPYDVMRYVVMHELSHVKHMDHSPEFWAQVRALYGFGVERAKRWLSQNGEKLHEYL